MGKTVDVSDMIREDEGWAGMTVATELGGTIIGGDEMTHESGIEITRFMGAGTASTTKAPDKISAAVRKIRESFPFDATGRMTGAPILPADTPAAMTTLKTDDGMKDMTIVARSMDEDGELMGMIVMPASFVARGQVIPTGNSAIVGIGHQIDGRVVAKTTIGEEGLAESMAVILPALTTIITASVRILTGEITTMAAVEARVLPRMSLEVSRTGSG